MTLSTSTDRVYTNGRLIIDEEMAFDIVDAVESKRIQLMLVRAELRDEGLGEAHEHLTKRMRRLSAIRKRVLDLIAEKGWGEPSDVPKGPDEGTPPE